MWKNKQWKWRKTFKKWLQARQQVMNTKSFVVQAVGPEVPKILAQSYDGEAATSSLKKFCLDSDKLIL